MDSCELIVMTPNGAMIGTFDSREEGNALYKFAKTMGYDIICRKVNYCYSIASPEKRYIADEQAFWCGFTPSIDGLKEVIRYMETIEDGPAITVEQRLEECFEDINRISERFKSDTTFTDEQKKQLTEIIHKKANQLLS